MKVGDYVRTTYGIGKIENAYIIYCDDGTLWRLCYITDNPKIDIGIYTKDNSWELFGEIQKDHSIKYEPLNVNTQKYFDMVYKQKLKEPVCYVPVVHGIPRNAELFDDHKFIKSSPNIIDVLEEHDFVQMQDRGDRFYEIERDYTGKLSLRDIGWDEYEELDETNIPEIVSIITHEQMEQMKYKVGENNDNV